MKAAFYDHKGPAAEVLRVGDLATPEPGPGEVRVRVHVSAVNPSDTKGRSAWDGNLAMPAPRIVPHQDGAGVIDRVGVGVSPARVGERVWIYEAQRDGRAFGTAAEYVVVPQRNVVSLPKGIGFDWGACLGIPGMTAHRCLFMDGPIQGQTVLVAGGAGAVGTAAIQLAAWAGARVIATVSRPEQAAVARAAGAFEIVDRKHPKLAERVKEAAGGEVDRIVEVAFAENLELDRAVLRTNGVIASYSSGPAQSAPAIPFRAVMGRGFTFHFVLVYVMPEEAHLKAAQDINACLAAGRYKPHIGNRFPLAETAAAHAAQEGGKEIGKILVEIA
jgi:NADPH2:quinone reductase